MMDWFCRIINRIYLPAFYFSEAGTARKIMELISVPKNIEVSETDSKLQKIEKANRIAYNDIQIEAIKCAVQSKVMVLTGDPVTGKTTTTLGIINIYKELSYRVILAAPTGRAAKSMSEATGMEDKTIHRLLEYKPPEGYQINEEKPLEGDVLILDECSMIDIILMYNLLKAVPKDMTVIFVGDTDQLSSVGAGNVLRDIIESEAVPVVKLERIFRQAMDSRIITNAHRINKGMSIEMRSGSNSDFYFIEESTPEKASELIVDLCSRRLPKHYRIDPVRDIQVLTPMQRGEVGAVNLNLVLQSTLNKNEIKLRRGGIEYRLRDKVMQIKNNYDKEVFNGDIGTIVSVNTEDRSLAVDFEGRSIEYDISELDELQLAYATTVHKSQGSEYPVVVLPFMMTHYVMLQRNLLYTAITRAKKLLVIVGEKKAVYCAIKNNSVLKRNTRLSERLAKKVILI